MRKKHRFYAFFLGITGLLIGLLTTSLPGCKKENPEPDAPVDTFDRTALLTQYADSVIIPNLAQMKLRADAFSQEVAAFNQNPDLAGLLALRLEFQAAYTAYVNISAFEFGPSETESIRVNCNTFPTDTAQILYNITAGSYNLFTAANIDAKGFPAIDYLLYGKNVSDNTIVSLFTASAARRTYLNDLATHLNTHITNIYTAWTTNYRSTFIASNGNDIGSSLGYIVNQLNYELEQIKNARIGIPLGKLSLGVPYPEKCENYYSGQSVVLASACLRNIEDFYLGRSNTGVNGTGLDNYLDHLGAQYFSGSLNTAILARFQDAHTKLQVVADPLSEQVINNPALVDTAYVAVKKLLILLKTDMPSNLGIVITYQDTDGD